MCFCIFHEPVGPRLGLLVLLEAPGGHPLDQDVHRVFWSRSRRWRGVKHGVGDVNGWTGILDLRDIIEHFFVCRFILMTHISGEGNVDTVVLSLLWRLHLVPLLSAWVLKHLFWTLSQLFGYLFFHLNLIEWRCDGLRRVPNT